MFCFSKSMDFLLNQTPCVFVKNEKQFLNLYVDHMERISPLHLFHKENSERTVIPVFKSESDANRFKHCALQSISYCYVFDKWETNEVYPMDINMSHLSITSNIKPVPKYLWNECELYDIVPFNLNDMDLILSLSLTANIGYFVVGGFHVVGNQVSMNGVVVDPALHNHFNDNEHMALMQQTYEHIYLT